MRVSGTPQARITIRSYDGPRSAHLAAFALHGRQYVEVVGLDISGIGGGNAFHVDGHSQYIILRDCFVHDAVHTRSWKKVGESTPAGQK